MTTIAQPKALLVFPPFHDPDMPYLAPRLLAAHLASTLELQVEIDDLNLRCYQEMLDNDRIKVSTHNPVADTLAIVTQFEAWLSKLEQFYAGTGFNVSYRKVHAPVQWQNSKTLAQYLMSEVSPLEQELKARIADLPSYRTAQLVGISIGVEDQILPSFTLCKIIREVNPHANIVVGGNVVTRFPGNITKSALGHLIDGAISGEGEHPFSQYLVNLGVAHNSQVQLHDTKSQLAYPKGSNPTKQPPLSTRALAQAKPSWPISEIRNYLAPEPVIPVLATRKCYWAKCDFCGIHSGWAQFQERNLNDVVAELKSIQANGYRFVRFVDEGPPPAYLLKLANAILDNGIELLWEAYSLFAPILGHDTVAQRLQLSGCRQLFLGLESVGPTTLQLIQKGPAQTKRTIKNVLSATASAGILNYVFLMVGTPTAPVYEELETVRFVIENLNIDAIALSSFVVDRLSPIHLQADMQKKYDITLRDNQDLKMDVPFQPRSADTSQNGNARAEKYVDQIFTARPDLALTSLITEEQRFWLGSTHGRQFARDAVNAMSATEIANMTRFAVQRAIGEKVSRDIGDVLNVIHSQGRAGALRDGKSI